MIEFDATVCSRLAICSFFNGHADLSFLARQSCERRSLRVYATLHNLSTAAYEAEASRYGLAQLFGELIQLSLRPAATGRFRPMLARLSRTHKRYARAFRRTSVLTTRAAQNLTDPSQIVEPPDRSLLRQPHGRLGLWLLCVLRVEGHGGGTAQAFRVLAEQDAVVLCFVDSDQTDPASLAGPRRTPRIVSDLMRCSGRSQPSISSCWNWRTFSRVRWCSTPCRRIQRTPTMRVWAEQHKKEVGRISSTELSTTSRM